MSTPSDIADPAAAATATLVRVEKGHADAEELAAVTAVLLARAAAGTHRTAGSTRPSRSAARWRRLERRPAFSAPHSWQG
ncbi:acyl-CoA carboxylase subunit epsilon [Streptomyces samsunensis]|uniref:Uncharacterized protein n=4 Tax=Streptomyces TaxID=1883 RepID=A0A291SXY3_STRMQ|nr:MULTISPECIES: acyl-CoA carboxylase subunit epsilon [Streptomyces]ATL85732.1 hypothetical protein SMALA_5502 [Streptomyces malaysiensis]AUA11008.1 hypothetical protein CFP59_03118 [Streptomyces sp. M56]MCC4322539.1 acyl-CoA carboxylase subunit epsilon [Streptomyces malaysiensis]MCM3807622.1 acyl-CoA carboxylase subunit epsilon [Streptomyces sp. DR7-3]MCQ6250590.1 acyl-CoA carboxylase subunit epsilon [Streptomyces malaysiensis]